MTLQEIANTYQNSYVLAIPLHYDAETQRVSSWKVIQTIKQLDDLPIALGYYRLEGFDGIIAIPLFDENDKRLTELPPNIAAGFWRAYLGLDREGGT